MHKSLPIVITLAALLVGCGARVEYPSEGTPIAPGAFLTTATLANGTECVVVHGYRGNAITCDWGSTK